MRVIVKLAAGTPARLMVVTWSVALALYFLGPVRYFGAPRLFTWIFIGACILCFALGSLCGRVRWLGVSTAVVRQPSRLFDLRINRIVCLTAFVGLVGLVCIAVDKLFLSGLDYSQGITALRFERAAEVEAGTAGELYRSPLLYIGYLTFSFSVASYLLYLLKAETLPRRTVWLAHLALLSPVTYSVLYGGRSPIGLVLGVVVGAMIVRMLANQPALGMRATGRWLLAIFVLLSVFYTNYVFTERRQLVYLSDYSMFRDHFEEVYEAEISPGVGRAIDSGSVDPDLLMNLVFTHYYITHELPMLDRTLAYDGPLGPYYGLYQSYILAALLGRVVPSVSIEETINTELREANVYGWFSTAWGGMYLDFGVMGGLLAVFACGFLSGQIYRRALARNDLGGKMIMSYVIAGILVSPVLSIFTISISLPILFSILVTTHFVRPIRSVSMRRVPAIQNTGGSLGLQPHENPRNR